MLKELTSLPLGRAGFRASRIGMGCWAVGGHGWGKVKEEESVAAIKAALDQGITHFDTADAYGLGRSETLLCETLGASRSRVTIATKGGVRWDGKGSVWVDTSPGYLRFAVEESLRRLQLESIPVYYLHKPDRLTPIEESALALEKLRAEGKIGVIGLSNCSAEDVERFLSVAPVAVVQARLNMLENHVGAELLEICHREGMVIVAWGALADGLLGGKYTEASTFGADDHRNRMAEFSGDSFRQRLECVASLMRFAESIRRPLSQVAIRWVLQCLPNTCCLFGAKTEAQVVQNVGADSWHMDEHEFRKLEELVTPYRR